MDRSDFEAVCDGIGGETELLRTERYNPDSLVCTKDGDAYGETYFSIDASGKFHC